MTSQLTKPRLAPFSPTRARIILAEYKSRDMRADTPIGAPSDISHYMYFEESIDFYNYCDAFSLKGQHRYDYLGELAKLQNDEKPFREYDYEKYVVYKNKFGRPTFDDKYFGDLILVDPVEKRLHWL